MNCPNCHTNLDLSKSSAEWVVCLHCRHSFSRQNGGRMGAQEISSYQEAERVRREAEENRRRWEKEHANRMEEIRLRTVAVELVAQEERLTQDAARLEEMERALERPRLKTLPNLHKNAKMRLSPEECRRIYGNG